MGLRARHHTDDLLLRNDRRLLGRTFPAYDLQIVGAQGSRLHDARGRTVIDFMMGSCVGNLGWNPPEIVAAVREHDGPMYVPPGALYPPWVELAGLLTAAAPGRMRRAFRAVGGSEAVELALQIAMTITGRHEIIALEGAYHGNTLGEKRLGTGAQLRPPLDVQALDRLEAMLKHRSVAAFIMEPVGINLGVLIPEDDFMRGLVSLCHAYGTLVIMDEVATGFGRTGAMFACEHYDIAPDIVCLAKAITSGIAPLGATLTTATIADACGDLDFYSTFGWHPVATEAAIATLQYWQQHRDGLLANVHARCRQFGATLRAMAWPVDVEVRCSGLAIAVSVGTAERASRVRERCLSEGLLVSIERADLLLFPALTVDEATAAEGLEILARCVANA
jgi:4-aminobutyrate aminotransferase-like enzyme